MKWLPAASFVVFATMTALPVDTHVLCPACVDRARDNSRCEWTGDTAVRLDLATARDRRHLVADAQLAEGLAVRFADAEHGRLFGTEHHGGLIDNGRVVHECTARLFSMIATNHGVSDAEIASARAERPAAFDSIVRGLFLPIYVLASLVVCRTIRRRFASDDGRVRFVALSLASVAVALLGSYLLVLWSMPWEAIRVGNGHIGGYRAATLNRHGPGIVFVVGLCLFWTVALLHRRVSARVTVGAAALSCAVLAAMFVRTFATGAVSWVVVSTVLVCVVAVLDAARDRTVADAETPSLRNT